MEKRKQKRYPLEVPAHITSFSTPASIKYDFFTKDISSHGVFINSNKVFLKHGEKVHLEIILTIDKLTELFNFSSSVTLDVNGLVTRRSSDGFVIKFEREYSLSPITGT